MPSLLRLADSVPTRLMVLLEDPASYLKPELKALVGRNVMKEWCVGRKDIFIQIGVKTSHSVCRVKLFHVTTISVEETGMTLE